uniref:Phosphoglycerate mutase n=2 Tax=Ornithorhynchus anatinus TaxID=9258 RepID=F6U1J6_ORNAN
MNVSVPGGARRGPRRSLSVQLASEDGAVRGPLGGGALLIRVVPLLPETRSPLYRPWQAARSGHLAGLFVRPAFRLRGIHPEAGKGSLQFEGLARSDAPPPVNLTGPHPSSPGSPPPSAMSKYKLVMLRHGEGAWNKENRFCSWVDQKLNGDGIKEAQNCGKQLRALNFEFDLVFTSVLNRSIHTAWLVLEEMGQEWVPVESSWRLNERHYGALIGLNREKMALNHGEEQVRIWRRSYDVTPPPIDESHPYYHEIYNDRRYKCCDVSPDKLPRSESLKEVLDRLLPYWTERIAPALKSGKSILISAHGNSSRALLKHLEGISDDDIINLTLPTGVPILLELDENLRAVGPHQFLGDQEAIQAAIKKVEDQGKVKRAEK